MKKLPSILATILFPFAMAGQPQTNITENPDSIIQTDSIVVAEAVPTIEENTLTSENPLTSSLTVIDGDEYVLTDGKAYKIDDLANYDKGDTKARLIQKVVMLAICFIVPCVTILAILIILMLFFLKKNRSRDGIIQKAIDSGYQLPDSFYTGQRTVFVDQSYPTDNSAVDNDSAKGPFGFKMTDPSIRDPKKFSSGVTLAAVGLAILLFFVCQREWGIGLLAGGIPLFIGLGRLIGYFYIPGYTSAGLKKDDYYRQHVYNHYSRKNNHIEPQTPSCPPPCPGERNENR